MLPLKQTIEDGDLVVIYFTPQLSYAVTVHAGEAFNCRQGYFKWDDCIGRKFGCSVSGRGKLAGHAHVLHPTPELWTSLLPHRTQIIYTHDISFIVAHLDLGGGMRVIESGTGSGSMTHALARTVGGDGHVYTYEYHEPRALAARAELKSHGLGDYVTVTHRDVCAEGFVLDDVGVGATEDARAAAHGTTATANSNESIFQAPASTHDVPTHTLPAVDAIFLDLPEPWLAIPHTTRHLTHGGRICCFSPCIEQVQRTCAALQSHGFVDIVMWETLERKVEGKRAELVDIGSVVNVQGGVTVAAGKRQREDDNDGDNDVVMEDMASSTTADKNAATESAAADTASSTATTTASKHKPPRHYTSIASTPRSAKGHSAYLTFATFMGEDVIADAALILKAREEEAKARAEVVAAGAEEEDVGK